MTLREKLQESQQEVKVLLQEITKKKEEIQTYKDLYKLKQEECEEIVTSHKQLQNDFQDIRRSLSFKQSFSLNNDDQSSNNDDPVLENQRLRAELSFVREQLSSSNFSSEKKQPQPSTDVSLMSTN